MNLKETMDYLTEIIDKKIEPNFTQKDCQKIKIWFNELDAYWKLEKARENGDKFMEEMALAEIESSKIFEKQLDKE